MEDSNNIKQVETALLTEHFRYTPVTLLDEIINTMNEVINRAIDAAEQGLLATDPTVLGFADKLDSLRKTRAKAAAEALKKKSKAAEGEDLEEEEEDDVHSLAQKEIEEGVYQLETLLNSTVDRIFDKFEIYVLRNLLSIPTELIPWIRLEHYKDLDFSPPKENEPTQEEVRVLARKVAETKKLESALQREVTTNNALLLELDFLLTGLKNKPIITKEVDTKVSSGGGDGDGDNTATPPSERLDVSFLTSGEAAKKVGVSFNKPSLSASSGNAHHPSTNSSLQTHTSFVISQLGHLEKLLSYLRPKLQQSPFLNSNVVMANTVTEHDPVSLRKAYLESRSRKIVSRHGMGLAGPNGSIPGVTGATTADLGQFRDEDELDALERLMGPLSPQEEVR